MDFESDLLQLLDDQGAFPLSSSPDAVCAALTRAAAWPHRAAAAAALSTSPEALLRRLVELPEPGGGAASSRLLAVLRAWLKEALALPGGAGSGSAPAFGGDAAAEECVACALAALARTPVDLRRIAESKIGHFVAPLNKAASELRAQAPGRPLSDVQRAAAEVYSRWTAAKVAADKARVFVAAPSTVVAPPLAPLATLAPLRSSSVSATAKAEKGSDASRKRPRGKEDADDIARVAGKLDEDSWQSESLDATKRSKSTKSG